MGRSNSVGYVDVSVWGKSGEACARHLCKGWLVGVTGRLEYREWPADDGSKRSAHAVTGTVDFLTAPKTQAAA
jgi:single-strand DNA-binding protein